MPAGFLKNRSSLFTLCTSCPLPVVENTKEKLRLVIDLRYVNQSLIQCKFKYEGIDLVPSLFRKGDFVFSFDLN